MIAGDTFNLPHEIDSFLMIGQSNMAGRGDFGEVPEIHNPLCYMLRMGRWIPMAEPINPDRAIFTSPFHSGTSLGASFADEYSTFFNRKVGLIPCADGGTRLLQWMPGEILFDHAVMMTKLAMRTSNIKGILWHQGETDCMNANDFENYHIRFIDMITELRRQIGIENLPVIIGELSYDIGQYKNMENRNIEFNKKLCNIKNAVAFSDIVSAEGLKLKNDGIHFNSVSYREFGKRYFDVYKNINS